VNEGDVIVKVGNKVLYKGELEENVSPGLSTEDSIIASEHYIRSWINDVLLYDIAAKNVYDKENIERLVNSYKKSLLIYQYQEQLINEKLVKTFDDNTLFKYYDEHKDKFKLENPLIKGVFLKVPADAPQIDDVRSWYKSTNPAQVEKVRKYSLNNAVVYDSFTDRWVDFNQWMNNNWPVDYNDKDAIVTNNKYIEQRDSSYYYFLNIADFLLSGENAPYEFAKVNIQEILINQRRIAFLKQMEDDLYQRAFKKGDIKFYKE
jgi:hypothetical protein